MCFIIYICLKYIYIFKDLYKGVLYLRAHLNLFLSHRSQPNSGSWNQFIRSQQEFFNKIENITMKRTNVVWLYLYETPKTVKFMETASMGVAGEWRRQHLMWRVSPRLGRWRIPGAGRRDSCTTVRRCGLPRGCIVSAVKAVSLCYVCFTSVFKVSDFVMFSVNLLSPPSL